MKAGSTMQPLKLIRYKPVHGQSYFTFAANLATNPFFRWSNLIFRFWNSLLSGFLPMTAFCQTHSWAWANMRYSRLCRKDSVSSSTRVLTSRLWVKAGRADPIRYESDPAAFYIIWLLNYLKRGRSSKLPDNMRLHALFRLDVRDLQQSRVESIERPSWIV